MNDNYITTDNIIIMIQFVSNKKDHLVQLSYKTKILTFLSWTKTIKM